MTTDSAALAAEILAVCATAIFLARSTSDPASESRARRRSGYAGLVADIATAELTVGDIARYLIGRYA